MLAEVLRLSRRIIQPADVDHGTAQENFSGALHTYTRNYCFITL